MNEKIDTSGLQVQTFEDVHLKLRGHIDRYVFYFTGKRQDVEDVAQEIFIKLWVNWSRVKMMNDDELKDYVFIMLRNYIINERKESNRPKRNKKMFLMEYSKTFSGCYLHDDILVTEGIKLHQKAVDQLAKKERIVYLYHHYDYSAAEIAKLLDRSSSFAISAAL